MGTSNFYNRNANRIYAIEINDHFEYISELEEIRHQMKRHGFETYKRKDMPRPGSDDRNYPALIVAEKSLSEFWGENEVVVNLRAIVRSGYYSGINLDYEFDLWVNNHQNDEPENDLEYWGNFQASIEEIFSDRTNAGLAKIHAGYAEAWIEEAIQELTEKIEGIYGQISRPLTVKAVASNGETIYQ